MARSLDDVLTVLSSISDADRWKLDQEIDSRHLVRIADSMTVVKWEGVVADHLSLSEADKIDIRENYSNKPSGQRKKALSMWKNRLGSGATYRALIEAFHNAGRVDLAKFVCELIGDIGDTDADELIRPPPRRIPRMSEPSSDYGLQENERADKFQRALIEARVTSGVLQFSEPFPWLPNDKSLYVRSAYKEMYTILDHDGRNYMIVGSPGTGKSYFAIYVLYHALRASKTVVFHRSSESAVYLFKPGQKAQKGRENNCTIQALNLSETLYLYDAATKKNPSISPEASRLIVFSSPSPENTNDLRKLRLVSMHMPTWSIDELLLASELDHYRGRITETIIKDLYEKFGGIPRYVLEVEEERKEEYMCLLESNIHDCNLRTIQRVGREDIGKESHMIFHRYSGPDNYYKYKIKFASQFVGDKVVKAIYEHGYDEMKAFVRRDDIPSVAASLRGWIFETIVHNELPNGGIYHVRKLSDNKEESRGLPKMKHTIFNKLEEAGIPHLSSSEYMYLQPKSKTFEAADAILPPNNIFQVTVSTCHFIKANGLKNILKELKKHRDWRSDTRVNYFFVVPPDVYTSFSREQNYHTANNSKVSKSDDFEIVDQYVLEFTF